MGSELCAFSTRLDGIIKYDMRKKINLSSNRSRRNILAIFIIFGPWIFIFVSARFHNRAIKEQPFEVVAGEIRVVGIQLGQPLSIGDCHIKISPKTEGSFHIADEKCEKLINAAYVEDAGKGMSVLEINSKAMNKLDSFVDSDYPFCVVMRDDTIVGLLFTPSRTPNVFNEKLQDISDQRVVMHQRFTITDDYGINVDFSRDSIKTKGSDLYVGNRARRQGRSSDWNYFIAAYLAPGAPYLQNAWKAYGPNFSCNVHVWTSVSN